MSVEVIQINDNTWRIEDNNHVRFFLLTGSEKALMIDSGMMINNAKDIAKTLTDLPIELINTHADRDHVGSNYQFDTFYMHPSEASNYYKTQGQTGDYTPISEGDVIDLGGRKLEIIAVPGHTPGSIAILDVTNRMIFSGDPVQDGTIFLFGVQREVNTYLKSLKKLDSMKDRFDAIYPSHGTCPVKPELINELYDAMSDVLNGKYTPGKAEFHGTVVNLFDAGAAKFLMDIVD